MLKLKSDKIDVGIIIGRFQTHDLSKGHIELIDSVRDSHDRVIIFLGLSPLRNTLENPLDFRCRRQMISEIYPDIEIHYIDDIPNDDELWSKTLDGQILKWKNPTQSVILYGSRDCFIKHYLGKFPTRELEATTIISATEIRKKVCNQYPPTKDYRAGIVASTAQRYPAVIPTVDVAIINWKNSEILLIKKSNEKKLRFTGGYAVKSPSYEDDAQREVREETKIEIGNLTYIGSALIDDPRYRGERDCIKTIFFSADYIYGKPDVSNNEDLTENIESYHWVSFDKLNMDILQDEHEPLLKLFLNYLKKNK